MKNTIRIATFGLGFFVVLGVHGQAPPGPIQADPGTISSSGPPPAPVKRVEPRKSIFGAWKLNRDESDDPRQKSQQRKASDPNSNHGGYPGSGPRVGWPGGGMGGGGMGGGHHPNGTQDPNSESKQRYQELLDPSIRLELTRKNDKDPIVEMTGDQGRKTIFYTDGKKPDTPQGVGTDVQEAKWDGTKLLSEASLPKNGSLKKTFEVSPDGLQMWEDVEMLVGKDKTPSKFHFVYDAVDPG